MPADTIRKQPPKGKGSGLNKKLGPLPVWGWGVGFVLAVAVGLYLRQKSANSAAGSPATATAPSADSGAGGVGGASSDPNTAQGIDTTGLQDAINQLGYVLGGGGMFTSTAPFDFGSIGASAATAPTAPYINSSSPGTIFTDSSGKTYAMQPSGSFAPAYIGPNGNYVSPLTYQGAGVTPQPITSQQVAPAKGIVTPQITPPADIVLRLPSAAAKKPATAKKK